MTTNPDSTTSQSEASAWHTTPTLVGRHATLRPLLADDVATLWHVGNDPDVWAKAPRRMVSIDDMQRYVQQALAERDAGDALPFVIVDARTAELVGSTRYGNVSQANRRLEIGWTWLALSAQRTGINTEAKLMLLAHAFDVLGCLRVELKTDVINAQSRAAILRLGAQEEGILRSHSITEDGRRRDTVYYSILDHEWPAVRANLKARLAARDQ